MSNISIVPNTLASSLNVNFGRMWMPRFISMGMNQYGLGHVVNSVLRSHSHHLQSSLSELLSGKFQQPSPRFNYRDEMKQLFSKLNIVDRMSESDVSPFGSLYLKFKNQDYGFIPMSKEMIPEEIQELLSSSSLNSVVKRAEQLLQDVSLPFNVHSATFIHETSRKIPTTIGMPLRVSIKMPTVMQASGTFKMEADSQTKFGKVKLIVKNFKPSIVSTLITKIECWSPIVNSGVKLIGQAKVFAPFSGSISIDTNKKPMEIKTTLEPELTKQEELFTVQTRPVTFTLVWPKYLQKWEEPLEKTVHGSEWTRVHKHKLEFGENVLGIKFQSRAHWHKTPSKRVPSTPFSVLAGPNKYTVTMQPGFEMPEQYVMSITGKMFKSFNKKEVNLNMGKFFEDSSEDFLSAESSEEREESTIGNDYYKTYKGKNPVNNEFEIKLETKGGSIKRQCKVESNCLCGSEMKSCKCKVQIKRTPVPNEETQPWKLVCEVKALYPKTPFLVSELTSDKQFMCEINTKWGPESNMNKKCDIKIVAEQSQKMQQLKEQSVYSRLYNNEQHRSQFQSLFSPVSQYKQTLKYGLLDEYKVDVDYQLTQTEQQLMNKLYRYVKNVFYKQSKVQQINIQNPQGHIRVKLNIDPINRRYMNCTIMTPKENCKLEDIPMWTDMSYINMRKMSTPSRSWSQFLKKIIAPSQSICEVRSNRVKTFDNVKYDIPTSTCYSILAKDCRQSQSPKFVVMIKKQSSSTEKKVLKIVTPTTKLVIKAKSDNQLECKLNNEQQSCSQISLITEHSGHVVLSCQKHQGYMQCQLPEAGIRVFFDGYAVNIKASPIYRSQLCGLCGQFDSEINNEWTSAQNSLVSRQSLLESYLVQEDQEQCQHEIPQYNTMLSFEDEQFETLPETIISPIRTQYQWQVRPIEQTKVIEQAHELCLSKQPVKKCPKFTYPCQYHESKQKVVYSCLPRNDIQAEIFQQQLSQQQQQVLSQAESLPASFTETERVPKKCCQY
jgi:hypothetical protein